MKKTCFARCLLLAALTIAAPPAFAQPRNLDIYWVDVEGGAATLIVSPSGESLLIDSGWEVGDRDAKRIFSAAQRAGLTKIDYFILSHYHADHAGGLVALSKLMPIGACFDRGDFIEPANQKWRDGYLSVCGKHVARSSSQATRFPIKGLQVDIVASDGHLIAQPVNGGGQTNPLCATAENKPKDVPENQLMVGALVSYGEFTFLDLADLDWEKEMELACPAEQARTNQHLAGRPARSARRRRRTRIPLRGPAAGGGRQQRTAQRARRTVARAATADSTCTTSASRRRRTSKASGRDTCRCSIREHNTAESMIANLEDTAALPGTRHPGLGRAERRVHDHQQPQRVQPDVHGAPGQRDHVRGRSGCCGTVGAPPPTLARTPRSTPCRTWKRWRRPPQRRLPR